MLLAAAYFVKTKPGEQPYPKSNAVAPAPVETAPSAGIEMTPPASAAAVVPAPDEETPVESL